MRNILSADTVRTSERWGCLIGGEPKTLCNTGFGPTGVCILAKRVNPKTGAVLVPVRNDTVTGLLVTGFPGNGVFG